jgi:hypothetical protein
MEYALGLIRTHRYAYRGEGAEWYRMTLGALWDTARSLHCASSDPTVIWCNGGRGSEVLAKKVCPGQTLFFNFLFSGASVRILNFSFFSRRHHTYHSRMVICLDHKIHYSLLSDQVLRIYKFFSGRSTESESVPCIV